MYYERRVELVESITETSRYGVGKGLGCTYDLIAARSPSQREHDGDPGEDERPRCESQPPWQGKAAAWHP